MLPSSPTLNKRSQSLCHGNIVFLNVSLFARPRIICCGNFACAGANRKLFCENISGIFPRLRKPYLGLRALLAPGTGRKFLIICDFSSDWFTTFFSVPGVDCPDVITQPYPQAYTRYASEPSYQPECCANFPIGSTGDVTFDYRRGRLGTRLLITIVRRTFVL